MYKILLTRRALKDLEKLNDTSKIRIKEKMNMLRDNPMSISKKLSSTVLGAYRLRVGDFRIIFDIDDDKVVVLRIGHRKDIYK